MTTKSHLLGILKLVKNPEVSARLLKEAVFWIDRPAVTRVTLPRDSSDWLLLATGNTAIKVCVCLVQTKLSSFENRNCPKLSSFRFQNCPKLSSFQFQICQKLSSTQICLKFAQTVGVLGFEIGQNKVFNFTPFDDFSKGNYYLWKLFKKPSKSGFLLIFVKVTTFGNCSKNPQNYGFC